MQFVALTSLMHVHAIYIHYKSLCLCIFYESYSLQQLHMENN